MKEVVHSDYPIPSLDAIVGSCKVSVIGVKHTPEFLIENLPFFRSSIEKCEAVTLEQAMGGEIYQGSFFGGLAIIANRSKKRIYSSDPTKDMDIPCSPDIIGGITLMGAGVARLSDAQTRRDFIVGAAATLSGACCINGSILPLLSEGMATGKYIGVSDIFGYGLMDFRNLSIGLGIKHLSKKYPSVNCYVGKYHQFPIMRYLENPMLLAAKSLAYTPLSFLYDSTLREYVKTGKDWKIIRKG